MSESAPSAFLRREGDRFIPAPEARGPWDPNSLHARLLSGLLAHTIEDRYGDAGFHFARLTIDLFRMPPLAPVGIETSLVREGNRIKVAQGSLASEGVEVARGNVVMLRRAPQPEGNVWTPPSWDVPAPEDIAPPEPRTSGRAPLWDTRPITGRGVGGVEQRRAWLRETRLLIEGEPLRPFARAAMAADYTNPFANSGDKGLNFVNADITLYLHRLPQTDWIGFEVASHQSQDGIAVGECTLYDELGAIGKSLVCSVFNVHRPDSWAGIRPPPA